MKILITHYYKIITNYDKKLLQITADLLQITAVGCYKLRQRYYKLRQKFITNKDKKLLQITAALIFEKFNLLQITPSFITYAAVFSVITNYGKFYYKLRQVLQITTLLQITS